MPNISISEAAARLGRKPWEVQRMIDAGELPVVVLVDEASIANLTRERPTITNIPTSMGRRAR